MRGQHIAASVGGWLGLLAAAPFVAAVADPKGFDFGTFPGPPPSLEPPRSSLCPGRCSDSGPTGFSWSVVPSISALKSCNETILFQSSLQTSITSVPESLSKRAQADETKYGPPCLASAELRSSEVDVQVSWSGDKATSGTASDVANALLQLQKNLVEDPTCGATTLLARSGNVVVGIWVGRQIRKTSAAAAFVNRFAESVAARATSLPIKGTAQLCGTEKPSSQDFGIFYDTTGKVSDAFSAMQGWSEGDCISAFEQLELWKGIAIDIIPASALSMGADKAIPEAKGSRNNQTAPAASRSRSTILSVTSVSAEPTSSVAPGKLDSRAVCKTVKVEAADSCYTIATQKCGIKLLDLYKFNGGSSELCNNLEAGSEVCCSSGAQPEPEPKPAMRLAAAECKYVIVEKGDTCTSIAAECGITLEQFYSFNRNSQSWCNSLVVRSPLPDLRPQKNSDGSCFAYTIQPDEGCYDIADRHRISEDQLHNFNKGKTWGWTGCGLLQKYHQICLSEGTPPMPSSISNAVCGPQKPGTAKPSGNAKLADLNPCPLNVCCNIWGQCGTTKDFCVDTTVDNTPGTAKEGTYGCVSNCGMDIVNKDTAPSQFRRLGYFEGWNFKRPCLNMDVSQIPERHYDVIHFAFGWISEDFQISAGPDVKEQFDKFVKEKVSYKKVISFGGWAFSNEPATSHIIRNAVKPQNAVKFATNLVAFVNANNLDGLDIDWEYPGATDIDGSQPGTEEDGKNYLAFLQLVKRRLGTSKTLAIAAPASFWYLKAFPIAEMAKVVDYIVYMTYDLAGQWDVGSKWAHDGCEGGNCLRSHVNSTMTYSSLSMITKAGVPSHKILVGVSSYGRSFKMSQVGCEGPDCTFQGARNQSPAKPGQCTREGGYIADAEMDQLMRLADSGVEDTAYRSYYDASSDSDILVYDRSEWVAWMSPITKARRSDYYKSLNMGGTTDWAIDLSVYSGQLARNKTNSDWGMMDLDMNCKFDKVYSSLDELDGDAADIPAHCAAMHAITVLEKMLSKSLEGFDAAADGYDGLYSHYKDYIIESLTGRLEKLMLFAKEDGGVSDTYFRCYAHKAGSVGADRNKATETSCFNLPTGKPYDDYTYWYEMRDKAAWEKFLNSEGILPEWLYYSQMHNPKGQDTCDTSNMCVVKNLYYNGYPLPIESSKIEVPNPKDIITAARNNMENITTSFEMVYMSIGLEDWDGGFNNAVEILSVPVFMLEDAVASMTQVKEIGKDWKEAQKKKLILSIIEGVLFLLGFLGPIAGTMGRVGAAIGRLASIIEASGAGGLAIYSIVEDPASAPLAILGLVLGELAGGRSNTGRDFAMLNAKKNEMTTKEKTALGKSYSANTPKVQSIMGKSCRRL
ncbi:killer toxin subunits alpha/beta [Plectosphaerella plurivora]|uniref:chitinase n=1 Tax=Plectosphaerella plurivora TaxID=936078 RepID=A0A9P8V501_9PEZI|nr:killer toxin subunits alpha/beta [Plectosphaerella plurivora]